MEFFLQFFFQPISRAVRLTIGGPLPLTYSSLNSTLQRVSLTHFFLFFLHSFVPFFYIVSYIHISFHVEPILEPIGHRGDWHHDSQTVDLRCSYRDSSSTWNVNPVTKRSSRIKWTSLTRGWGRGEGEGEQTNKGKTKTRERSRSLFLGRVVLAYSWHVSRVLSPLFQIRNTLGAEGFPISPSFIARVSGYHHHYGIRRETQRGRDAIQPRRRRVYVF